MRNQHTRDILFLDLTVVPEPPAAPRKTMGELGSLFQRLFAAQQTARWNRLQTEKTYLRDFALSEDGAKIWMLLCSTDVEAPGASFAHLATNEQRDEEKRDGEGRPETSHLLITMDETNAGSRQYLALFEESQRFPRVDIERYLNFLMRQAYKFYRDEFSYASPSGERKRDGSAKMVAFHNSVSVAGHLSSDFAADIEAGMLRGISLQTSLKTSIGFGESKRLIPVLKQIKLSVADSWKESPVQLLKEAFGLGKANNMEAAKVVFATPDQTTHTAILETETGNVLNDGYIKKVRLSAKDITLPEACRVFSPVLQDRMLRLLG